MARSDRASCGDGKHFLFFESILLSYCRVHVRTEHLAATAASICFYIHWVFVSVYLKTRKNHTHSLHWVSYRCTLYHARKHTTLGRFSKLGFSTTGGECNRRATPLWRVIDEIFPEPPFSLCVPPKTCFWRKSAQISPKGCTILNGIW